MVPRPPFGAKGVVSFSIKVKVVVQLLCGRGGRDGLLAGLFPCGTNCPFKASTFQICPIRVPGPQALATKRGCCLQGTSRVGNCRLFEPWFS